MTILSMLAVSTQQIVLARELKSNLAEGAYTAMVEKVNELSANIEGVEANPVSEHKMEYTFKDKTGEPKITIEKAGGEVTLELKSGYEQSSVTTENLDYEKEGGVINDDFLIPYFTHMAEILDDEKAAFEYFQEGAKEVEEEGVYKVTDVETVVNEDDEDGQINFQIQVEGEGMEDGIYGELTDDKKIFKLRLVTKYFQNEIILNIRTMNYIKIESKNVLTEMLNNMQKMIKLNENNSSSGEQVLEDEEITESINESMKPLEENGMVKSEENGKIIFKKDDAPVLELEISEQSVGGFAFTQIKATLSSLEDKEFVQNFLKNSLYNMSSMVDSYLEEITKFTLRSVLKENPEEYVPAFAEDNAEEEVVLDDESNHDEDHQSPDHNEVNQSQPNDIDNDDLKNRKLNIMSKKTKLKVNL